MCSNSYCYFFYFRVLVEGFKVQKKEDRSEKKAKIAKLERVRKQHQSIMEVELPAIGGSTNHSHSILSPTPSHLSYPIFRSDSTNSRKTMVGFGSASVSGSLPNDISTSFVNSKTSLTSLSHHNLAVDTFRSVTFPTGPGSKSYLTGSALPHLSMSASLVTKEYGMGENKTKKKKKKKKKK